MALNPKTHAGTLLSTTFATIYGPVSTGVGSAKALLGRLTMTNVSTSAELVRIESGTGDFSSTDAAIIFREAVPAESVTVVPCAHGLDASWRIKGKADTADKVAVRVFVLEDE